MSVPDGENYDKRPELFVLSIPVFYLLKVEYK